jgi:hypothetical protein
MNTKRVHQLDDEGFYVGSTEADESPREPGVFLIPAGCVEPEPPPHVEGSRRKFQIDGWVYVAIPKPAPAPEPEPADPPTLAELNAPVLAEIAAEEAKQGRAVREALLLLLPAGAEKDRLKAIDDKIALARARLQK